ncbi:MAG TPA: cupin-like domain-containing protein [Acidobacteriaceae bacterium]|nr:cupin-like domain-containing protein [Acidobacteriaceae bacterium]
MTQTQTASEAIRPSRLPAMPIERRSARSLPYREFVQDYVVTGRPLILEDSAEEWPALRTWTPAFFRNRFGSRMVDVTYGVRRRLDEVMDEVLTSTPEKPGPYLHKVIIHQHMPELLPDLMPESIYGFPRRYASPLMPPRFHRPDGYLKLLIGGVGGKFPLMHFDSDNANAFITEIYGDKEFVLFRPEDTPLLYPHGQGGNTSQIEDPDHPDLERFPLFEQATQYRGIIRPGESAFIPSRWWHTARVVTTSISVCVNMLHGANWAGFVSESCRPGLGSWPVRQAKRLYLHSAGAVMTMAERSQQGRPDGALARAMAALCPAGPLPQGNRNARS